eukprot:sb/3471531/
MPAYLFGRKHEFRVTYYSCQGYFDDNVRSLLFPKISATIFLILPMFILASGTVFLLVFLLRMRNQQRFNRQGIAVLILVSATYFTSFLPYGVLMIHRAKISVQRWSAIYYSRFAFAALLISFTSNPLIYWISIRSFKEHTAQWFQGITAPVAIDTSSSKGERDGSDPKQKTKSITVHISSVV